MVELYTDFIKILGVKELSRMDCLRENQFCSLLQFALQYESQVMPDLGRIKATTLRHMGQRKGISLLSFSSHKFSTSGDASEMADRQSGSSLLKCS